MKRTQLILLGALLAIAVLIAVLALRNPQPPMVPADSDHARFDGAEACLECHGPDGGLPRSPTHPVGQDCMRCHGRKSR